MRFSIVITTYNRVDLLKRAISSALSQTIPCEVVVVDDCSSDGTEDYVRSLGEQVVYHRNSENLGHSKSINLGVELASGDWVKPFDDDDYIAPNCIEWMQTAIALCPNPVLCSCQAAQVDLSEKVLSRTIKAGSGKVFYIPQSDVHFAMLLERVPLGTPIQVAFQREAFLKTGGWNSDFDVNSDDSDSWIRIARYGDVVFINECLAYRTIWPGAYNYRVSICDRLKTNLLVKERIYPLVQPKYQTVTPSHQDIAAYLSLHWGLVACKHHKISDGLQLILPHLLNIRAWQILYQAFQFRHHQTPHPLIETCTVMQDDNPDSTILLPETNPLHSQASLEISE